MFEKVADIYFGNNYIETLSEYVYHIFMSFCLAWHQGYPKVESNLSWNQELMEKNMEKVDKVDKISVGCSHSHGSEIIYMYRGLFTRDVEEEKEYSSGQYHEVIN